ncbi:hypothetical protein SAMN02745163_02347 [Clostridium cavendishii DSM 21758]|uniref:Uncharacterized protein n=1 Tax=Clostridium cavendishii DSM 21758 TaxID=1121302 RepID=A0A1M6KZT6_9CLOT|nr:hypothetical protein [Clostridium cavendishii]SHJ64498.1 hypothetical protein SAMN02745163_02347 [Clostridium cavendishii DSM 21758]
MGSSIFYKEKSKILYFILILNIIFPIISIEGLIPWTICIFFMYSTKRAINEEVNPMKKVIIFFILNALSIGAYNVIVNLVSNNLAKMLL